MIKIGCAGYQVRQSVYHKNLHYVEIGDRSGRRPKDVTLKKWREQAPKEFEFVIRAPQIWIDPVKSSGIRWNGSKGKRSLSHAGSPESEIRRLKEELNARIVLFELPTHFHATPDRVTRFQNLIRAVPNSNLSIVWNAPKNWPATLIQRLSHSLKLVSVSNPLTQTAEAKSPFHYFRITGAPGTKLSDDNMKIIKRACGGKLTYVTFDFGPTSYYEALRFSQFTRGSLT